MQVYQANHTDLQLLILLFNGYRIFYKQPSDIERAKQFLSERLLRKDSIIFMALSEKGNEIGPIDSS
ncbi:MAG TPA: hypothetical protein DEA82_07735 [Flavobacteriaceae bacterium]|nr:hypothetical protein [Flavobacteriaceae bacterium]HBR54072.1 hypothetical protein [Flavobacteriaceae bacterium]